MKYIILTLLLITCTFAQDSTRYAWDMGQDSDLKEYEFYIYHTDNIQYGFGVSDLVWAERLDSLVLSAEVVVTDKYPILLDYTVIGAIAVDSADNHSEMSIGVFYNGQTYMIIPSGFMRLE